MTELQLGPEILNPPSKGACKQNDNAASLNYKSLRIVSMNGTNQNIL